MYLSQLAPPTCPTCSIHRQSTVRYPRYHCSIGFYITPGDSHSVDLSLIPDPPLQLRLTLHRRLYLHTSGQCPTPGGHGLITLTLQRPHTSRTLTRGHGSPELSSPRFSTVRAGKACTHVRLSVLTFLVYPRGHRHDVLPMHSRIV